VSLKSILWHQVCFSDHLVCKPVDSARCMFTSSKIMPHLCPCQISILHPKVVHDAILFQHTSSLISTPVQCMVKHPWPDCCWDARDGIQPTPKTPGTEHSWQQAITLPRSKPCSKGNLNIRISQETFPQLLMEALKYVNRLCR